jgi:hypothetical protein
MKKLLFLFALALFVCKDIQAQSYCNVTTANAYSIFMPGITNFTLNTIDRNSLDLECGGVSCNSYVLTGESTVLEAGKSYNFSITHTADTVYFPTLTNNIRIWIDFDQNGTLDDAGEEIVSMNYQDVGVTTGSFTVPADVTLGDTRMRVTIKMSQDGGHTIPTPCDLPKDPLGYHGEIEDYAVTFKAPTGINNDKPFRATNIFPNPSEGIFEVQSSTKISTIEITNLVGGTVYTASVNAKTHSINLRGQPQGIYLYSVVNTNSEVEFGKLIVN